MEIRTESSDESGGTTTSGGVKPKKPTRRSMVERELETNMTERVTSPLSVIKQGLNTSRYGRARKTKSANEFFDTEKAVSNFLKSPKDCQLPNKSSTQNMQTIVTTAPILDNPTDEAKSTDVAPSPIKITKMETPKLIKLSSAETLIEKIHNENLSLSRFGNQNTRSNTDKTYVRKDLIQRPDSETIMLNNMFSPQKTSKGKSSHLSILLDRSTADKSHDDLHSSLTENATPSAGSATKPKRKRPSSKKKADDPQTTDVTKIESDIPVPNSADDTKIVSVIPANHTVVKTLDFNNTKPKETKPKRTSARKQPQTTVKPNKVIDNSLVVKTLDFDSHNKKTKKDTVAKINETSDQKKEDDITKKSDEVVTENKIIITYIPNYVLVGIEAECTYKFGDIVWSRVGTYPFWPCIITREPFSELFVKKKLFGRVEHDVYHVTFFADNGRRGWIVDNMLRQYLGIEEFLAARDAFTAEDKKKDPRYYAAHFISDKRREIWDQSVSEAENLLKQPKHLRVDILNEMLSQNKNVKILKKPKNLVTPLINTLTTPLITPIITPVEKPVIEPDVTDSDVSLSLSESLYDSLFSDEDCKTNDFERSKKRSKKKSFDVSEVVTACLDSMAVKAGMPKIQRQSHMDRWLQKAKSQTPEKRLNEALTTPNKDMLSKVAPNLITPNKVTPDIVMANKVTPNNVTPNKVTPDIVMANKVTPNNVTPNKVTPDIVMANKVTPNNVTPNKVLPNTVTSNNVTPNKVTPNKKTTDNNKRRNLTLKKRKRSSFNSPVLEKPYPLRKYSKQSNSNSVNSSKTDCVRSDVGIDDSLNLFDKSDENCVLIVKDKDDKTDKVNDSDANTEMFNESYNSLVNETADDISVSESNNCNVTDEKDSNESIISAISVNEDSSIAEADFNNSSEKNNHSVTEINNKNSTANEADIDNNMSLDEVENSVSETVNDNNLAQKDVGKKDHLIAESDLNNSLVTEINIENSTANEADIDNNMSLDAVENAVSKEVNDNDLAQKDKSESDLNNSSVTEINNENSTGNEADIDNMSLDEVENIGSQEVNDNNLAQKDDCKIENSSLIPDRSVTNINNENSTANKANIDDNNMSLVEVKNSVSKTINDNNLAKNDVSKIENSSLIPDHSVTQINNENSMANEANIDESNMSLDAVENSVSETVNDNNLAQNDVSKIENSRLIPDHDPCNCVVLAKNEIENKTITETNLIKNNLKPKDDNNSTEKSLFTENVAVSSQTDSKKSLDDPKLDFAEATTDLILNKDENVSLMAGEIKSIGVDDNIMDTFKVTDDTNKPENHEVLTNGSIDPMDVDLEDIVLETKDSEIDNDVINTEKATIKVDQCIKPTVLINKEDTCNNENVEQKTCNDSMHCNITESTSDDQAIGLVTTEQPHLVNNAVQDLFASTNDININSLQDNEKLFEEPKEIVVNGDLNENEDNNVIKDMKHNESNLNNIDDNQIITNSDKVYTRRSSRKLKKSIEINPEVPENPTVNDFLDNAKESTQTNINEPETVINRKAEELTSPIYTNGYDHKSGRSSKTSDKTNIKKHKNPVVYLHDIVSKAHKNKIVDQEINTNVPNLTLSTVTDITDFEANTLLNTSLEPVDELPNSINKSKKSKHQKEIKKSIKINGFINKTDEETKQHSVAEISENLTTSEPTKVDDKTGEDLIPEKTETVRKSKRISIKKYDKDYITYDDVFTYKNINNTSDSLKANLNMQNVETDIVCNFVNVTNDTTVVKNDDFNVNKNKTDKNTEVKDKGKLKLNGVRCMDVDALPEFAHLMDFDVSFECSNMDEAIKVNNISVLTEDEVLAKVCDSVNDNAMDVVNIPAENEVIKKLDAVIIETDCNTFNLDSDKSQIVIDLIKDDVVINNVDIEAASSCISISDNVIEAADPTDTILNISTDNKDIVVVLNDCLTTEDENPILEVNDPNEAKTDEDALKMEEKSPEVNNTRKQRAKPENKLTNDVYKALDNPEFAEYLELRQDALLDENPHLSEDDVMKYLYKTWIYEQSFKPDNDIKESNLIKGLSREIVKPKKKRKKNKAKAMKDEFSDEDKEVLTTRDMPKRKASFAYYNEDDTDIEDELKVFEIFRTKKKSNKLSDDTSSTNSWETKDIKEKTAKVESESDDLPLATLINTNNNENTPEIVLETTEVIEAPFNQVEYYFSQLTQPKPNVFKGLVRERVCDICFRTSNLIKCKGPCNGMFHLDCVRREVEPVTLPSSIRGRKKKRPRGRKPKDELDESFDTNNPEELILDPTESIVFDADNFESELAAKMQEIIEKETIDDLASSDDELKWDDVDTGHCKIVDITLKKRRNRNDNDFKCNQCLNHSTPVCFVCKSEKSPKKLIELRQRCQLMQCHKYYHLECLDFWPQTQFNQGESLRKSTNVFDILSCPRHVCHTCVSDDPRGFNTRFSGDKLARCVKCPATYHSFTKCLPAGSQILSASQIICPRHYENRPGKVPCHVNTGWCFICALGGSLICCEYCPTSFHADCLNIAPPEGNYMCEDCETGRLPLYGEMVWVKLGHYRWWPGLVLHPCEVPDNVKMMKHLPGEFVVRFFGQYDHYWVNRGRVFPFQEGDSGRVSSQKSKIDEAFSLAIEHAQRAYQILKTAPPNSEEESEIATSFLPPQYVKLRVNKPCGSVTINRPDDDHNMSLCECDPMAENPCDFTSACLNRMLLTECGPTCRAGDRCHNRAFEKRLYPKMAPYRTPHRGWGLRALQDILAGQFVIEYVGELIDETEFRRRMDMKHEIRDENFYFLTLDKERMIDAGPKGNMARFMNHSCEPNCETQKWTVLGDVRVGLFALQDIPAYTELTFNYNLECAGIEKKRCMCGALRCSGYIGAKPKTLEEINPKKKRIYKKRKKEELPVVTKVPKIPKPRTTQRSKPKELTEIEKDLLIIKNATVGLSSDSECSIKLLTIDDQNSVGKRKRSFSSEGTSLFSGDEMQNSKVLKLDSDSNLDCNR